MIIQLLLYAWFSHNMNTYFTKWYTYIRDENSRFHFHKFNKIATESIYKTMKLWEITILFFEIHEIHKTVV